MLAISVSDSLFRTSRYIETLNSSIQSYTHTLSAWKGYENATFALVLKPRSVEKWLLDGLGRHIEVFDSKQTKIFEGFVNSVSPAQADLSLKRGALVDVVNDLSLIYTPLLNTSTDNRVAGTTTTTPSVTDVASQTLYGKLTKVMSTGTTLTTEALSLRDNQLSTLKDPETTPTVSIRGGGGGSVASVVIEILGYSNFLAYPYADTTKSSINISTKIQNIITQEPNSIISTDFSNIQANTFQVNSLEASNNLGLSLIKGLVSLGDVTNTRYLFGVYNERIAQYAAIPDFVSYERHLTDPKKRITNLTGKEIKPFNVLPGKWLLFSDFLIGQDTPSDFRLDPRMVFIEKVTFTAPYDISINGGKTNTLNQQLAKKGLGGVTF